MSFLDFEWFDCRTFLAWRKCFYANRLGADEGSSARDGAKGMDARDFEAGKATALKECVVPQGLFARGLPRLERFR